MRTFDAAVSAYAALFGFEFPAGENAARLYRYDARVLSLRPGKISTVRTMSARRLTR